MSTTKGQRIGIWAIAVLMAVGTIGSFAIIVIANANSQKEQTRYQELAAQYQTETADYKKKVGEKYFAQLDKQKSRVASFDKASVKKLVQKDITQGTGQELTASSSFYAYYIGWNPSGKIFDSSFNEAGDGLKDAFNAYPGGVIEGWTEGVIGMKEGGIRELTIPASMAYGEQDKSATGIPPNTPLKFILLVIPAAEMSNAPQPSEELLNLYQRLYGR